MGTQSLAKREPGASPSAEGPPAHPPEVGKAGSSEACPHVLPDHCGNPGHKHAAPLPGSYSWSVSPFGGEDKGGNDQKLKLANGKQLRPGI